MTSSPSSLYSYDEELDYDIFPDELRAFAEENSFLSGDTHNLQAQFMGLFSPASVSMQRMCFESGDVGAAAAVEEERLPRYNSFLFFPASPQTGAEMIITLENSAPTANTIPPRTALAQKQIGTADPHPPTTTTTTTMATLEHDIEPSMQRFNDFFKILARPMRFENIGTFQVEPRFKLQYLRASQPIPDKVICHFAWFKEKWRSHIDYVLLPCGTTVLKFRFVHEESGEETMHVETASQADARGKSHMSRTVCNRLFLKALGKCADYLRRLPPSKHTITRLNHVTNDNGKRKCTESIGLFGLRTYAMHQACVAFIQEYEQQKRE